MKRLTTISSLFIFLCFTLNINAQISIGPKIGLNFAKWSGDFEEFLGDSKNRKGFQIGASSEIVINDLISIQPEILYIQKGMRATLTENFSGYTYSSKVVVDLNYLEIPILVKIKFGPEDGIQFFANAGPSLAYGLNGRIKQEIDYGLYQEVYDNDLGWKDNEINRTDISLALGAGTSIPTGPVHIFLEARYLLSLISIDDSGDSAFKNIGIGISLGARIAL